MLSSATRRTRLTATAQREYHSAIQYYKREGSVELAARFISEVDRVLQLICQFPAAFPGLPQPRRALLKIFPYQIVYKDLGDVLLVVGFVHTSRDPALWQSRSGLKK